MFKSQELLNRNFGKELPIHVTRVFNVEPIGCPETSVRNYYYTLCNSPEEDSSQRQTAFLYVNLCPLSLISWVVCPSYSRRPGADSLPVKFYFTTVLASKTILQHRISGRCVKGEMKNIWAHKHKIVPHIRPEHTIPAFDSTWHTRSSHCDQLICNLLASIYVDVLMDVTKEAIMLLTESRDRWGSGRTLAGGVTNISA
jgi:hypothetical protein